MDIDSYGFLWWLGLIVMATVGIIRDRACEIKFWYLLVWPISIPCLILDRLLFSKKRAFEIRTAKIKIEKEQKMVQDAVAKYHAQVSAYYAAEIEKRRNVISETEEQQIAKKYPTDQ